jgi:hypothetical protein
VSLRDMKIGPVFAPVFQHHQKLVFDAKRVGLASKATPPCLQMCFSERP